MSPLDSLRSLWQALAGNRSRVWLTLVGMIIGSATIVILASLIRGGREALMRADQSATESDLIEVWGDATPPRERNRTQRPLSESDASLLRDSAFLQGAQVVSKGWKDSRAFFRGRDKPVSIDSNTPSAPALYRLGMLHGRFIDDQDMHDERHVCVVGYEVWKDLLGAPSDLSGLTLRMAGQEWTVVGAMIDKPMIGIAEGSWVWNRRVVVPQTTFDALYNHERSSTRLFVRLAAAEDLVERLDFLKPIVRGTILRAHYGVHNFTLPSEDKDRKQRDLILSVVQTLLFSTGFLAMFVGGINIMNIMLVTVTERTREIGIRRALGAPPSAILTQFMLEAAAIALLGGILGVGLGIGVAAASAKGLEKVVGVWNLHIEPWSIALGLGLSLVTGLVFGILPALRAARLNPVDALRFE